MQGEKRGGAPDEPLTAGTLLALREFCRRQCSDPLERALLCGTAILEEAGFQKNEVAHMEQGWTPSAEMLEAQAAEFRQYRQADIHWRRALDGSSADVRGPQGGGDERERPAFWRCRQEMEFGFCCLMRAECEAAEYT